jgi:hypothetical protein
MWACEQVFLGYESTENQCADFAFHSAGRSSPPRESRKSPCETMKTKTGRRFGGDSIHISRRNKVSKAPPLTPSTLFHATTHHLLRQMKRTMDWPRDLEMGPREGLSSPWGTTASHGLRPSMSSLAFARTSGHMDTYRPCKSNVPFLTSNFAYRELQFASRS